MLDAAFSAALDGSMYTDVRWFPEIDSTNRLLMEEALAGAPAGTVAITDYQSAGRGRRQREWVADRGASVLASVLLRPPWKPSEMFTATASVGLAIVAACEARGFSVRLKWPNDVIAGERKVAGILAESVIDGGRVDALVIGFGVNVNGMVPPWLASRAVTLEELSGKEFDRRQFVLDVLLSLEENLALGPSVLIRYREKCATLGRAVRIQTESQIISGIASNIDDEGLLEVQSDGQLHRFAVGDVVHAGAG